MYTLLKILIDFFSLFLHRIFLKKGFDTLFAKDFLEKCGINESLKAVERYLPLKSNTPTYADEKGEFLFYFFYC